MACGLDCHKLYVGELAGILFEYDWFVLASLVPRAVPVYSEEFRNLLDIENDVGLN